MFYANNDKKALEFLYSFQLKYNWYVSTEKNKWKKNIIFNSSAT